MHFTPRQNLISDTLNIKMRQAIVGLMQHGPYGEVAHGKTTVRYSTADFERLIAKIQNTALGDELYRDAFQAAIRAADVSEPDDLLGESKQFDNTIGIAYFPSDVPRNLKENGAGKMISTIFLELVKIGRTYHTQFEYFPNDSVLNEYASNLAFNEKSISSHP